MTTIALSSDHFGFPIAGDGVSLIGLPAERSAKRALPGSADKVLKNISSLLDEMFVDLITRRTATEFEAQANKAFPKYVDLVLAFGKIVSTIVPREKLVRLSSESFSELEADLRQHGLAAFGENMTERAIFTVWTLRKTADLLDVLVRSEPPCDKEKDVGFATNFLFHALRARFHVDCLIASMRTRQPLYPDVLPVIDDGLRSVVNAYAWVKQSIDLRFPSDDSEPLSAHWSDEDQALVNASMLDLARHGVE
jgi:hypothetical protein